MFAQEALLRGKDGRGAGQILDLVNAETLYNFDQTCRTTAIRVASAIGLTGVLSINFMPNAIYEPRACIRQTLWAADKHNFPPKNIIFEFTENESVQDKGRLKDIVRTYREIGFRTALDDFGAGHSGLSLIADVVPDIVKIDREIVKGLDTCPVRQAIMRAMAQLCRDLGVDLVAEGIETEAEMTILRELGVHLQQGFYLARPQFEALVTRPIFG